MRVARQKSIVDEEVFFDRELWITTLKVASTIVAHAMAKDQILSARWCANWIGLDKAQALDRTRQRHGAEQCSRYRVFAKFCQGDRVSGQDIYPLTFANPFVCAWQFPNDAFWVRSCRFACAAGMAASTRSLPLSMSIAKSANCLPRSLDPSRRWRGRCAKRRRGLPAKQSLQTAATPRSARLRQSRQNRSPPALPRRRGSATSRTGQSRASAHSRASGAPRSGRTRTRPRTPPR